jgi:ankyrin repeat protein
MTRLSQENIRGDVIRNTQGNNLLHSACEVGNLSLIYSLLEIYDVTHFLTLNQEGMSPVHVACQHNMTFILMFFLKNQIVTGTELTGNGNSVVHIAAQYNAVDVVSYLILTLPSHLLWSSNQQGPFTFLSSPHPSPLSVSGLSPLHVAAAKGNLQILEKFSTVANDEFSQPDADEGRTCLHWAAVSRHYHVIKFLIHLNKIDPNQIDRYGKTADEIHSDPVTHFLIYGTFLSSSTIAVPKNVTVAVDSSEPTHQPEGVDEVQDKEAEEEEGAGTMPVSVEPTVVEVKFSNLEKPIGKLNVKDNWIKKQEEIVEDTKQEITLVEPVVTTAIPSSTSPEDSTTQSIPSLHDPQKTLMLFDWVSVDNKITELENYLGVAPEMKIDVNTIRHPVTGESLLHRACHLGHLAVAQFLVEGVGSDVNYYCDEKNHNTTLHAAVEGSNVLIVRYLVKYCGALLNIQNKNNETALEMSQKMEKTDDREEITKIILKAIGKNPEKRTKITLPVFQNK